MTVLIFLLIACMSRLDDAKHEKAAMDIAVLMSALGTYHLHNNSFPPTLAGLYSKPVGVDLPNWTGPYIKSPVPLDPWGRPYIYVYPGIRNPDMYDLSSLGRDGKEGGVRDDSDITNWQQ